MGLLYLSSMQSQSGLIFFIIGLLGACFILNIFYAMRCLRLLRLEFPRSIRMTEGGASEDSVTIRNLSGSPQGMIQIRSKFGRVLSADIVPPSEETHLPPAISFPVRGVYPVSGLMISSSFPFGLVHLVRHLDNTGEFLVVPKVYDCSPPPAGGFEPMLGGSFAGKHKSPSGSSFAGIRPFTSDDSFKHIHWKSSSKGLGLMVKEFSEELSGRVAIVVDRGCGPVDASGESSLDRAVRLAGSLAFSALDAGHHVDMLALHTSELHHFPPFSDGSALLDLLARLEPSGSSVADRESIRKAAESAPRRASLCFVLASGDPDIFAQVSSELAGEGRTVTMYAPSDTADTFDTPEHVRVKFYTRDTVL